MISSTRLENKFLNMYTEFEVDIVWNWLDILTFDFMVIGWY